MFAPPQLRPSDESPPPPAAGAGSFIPRVQEIIKGGDLSQAKVFEILSADPRGDSASERVGKISSVVDPKSPLGMQLQDLEKRKRELESETDEQRIAREKQRARYSAGPRPPHSCRAVALSRCQPPP